MEPRIRPAKRFVITLAVATLVLLSQAPRRAEAATAIEAALIVANFGLEPIEAASGLVMTTGASVYLQHSLANFQLSSDVTGQLYIEFCGVPTGGVGCEDLTSLQADQSASGTLTVGAAVQGVPYILGPSVSAPVDVSTDLSADNGSGTLTYVSTQAVTTALYVRAPLARLADVVIPAGGFRGTITIVVDTTGAGSVLAASTLALQLGNFDPAVAVAAGLVPTPNTMTGELIARGGATSDAQGNVTAVQPVIVDIKPGTFPNGINLGSNGIVPVAMLGSAAFNATKVDPLSVTLNGEHVHLKSNKPQTSLQDVNGDGFLDFVGMFDTSGLTPVDGAFGVVLGVANGQLFTGIDSMQAVH